MIAHSPYLNLTMFLHIIYRRNFRVVERNIFVFVFVVCILSPLCKIIFFPQPPKKSGASNSKWREMFCTAAIFAEGCFLTPSPLSLAKQKELVLL